MVANFTRKINYCRLVRANQNTVKLRGLYTGSQNPKLYAQRLAHMWGVVIELAKKTIMVTTQNSVRCVMIPLTKLFLTRQAMCRRQRSWGTTYTNTMI